MKAVLFLLSLCTYCVVQASPAYKIGVEVKDTSLSEIYLGYHYANKQYIVDTALCVDGKYIFEGEDPLESGIYLVVFPPDNKYLELIIDEDQDFSLTTNYNLNVNDVKISGNLQNECFYDFINFMGEQRHLASSLKDNSGSSEEDVARLEEQLLDIDKNIEKEQSLIFKKFPSGLVSALIKSGIQISIPDSLKGSDDEIKNKRFRHYKSRYFDNIDLTDDRLIRTPFIHPKVMDYIDKLTFQHPDSIVISLDYVLARMNPEGDLFKHFLIHFINKYNQSEIVGMDAVFVHLAEKYYETGLATWTSEENMASILKRAKALKPILIGKIAPDFSFALEDGSWHRLSELEKDYTVLFFWDPKCGHCKKQIPHALDFYKKYKDKSVEFVAICTKRENEVSKCWEAVREKGMVEWINGFDPYVRYKPLYDITKTPQIFVLNKDKKILSKRISAQQLDEVMTLFMESKSDMTE